MSAEHHAWDLAHVWHPYTRRATLVPGEIPLMVRGEGIHLVDDAGRRYIDAISSWWCCSLGHGHPRLLHSLAAQAPLLQHSILGNMSHPAAAELAMRLAHLMPTPDRHVLFASDGASAVEQALKIAVQHAANTGRPERTRFACIEGAYHGDTLGAMSLGYQEAYHRPFRGLLAPADRLPFPTDASFAGHAERLAPHAGEYAAVIVEPLVLGAAGMRMYPAAWLTHLADWCAENNVLLLVDEVATGFGRTGTLFAFEQAGIDPDIVCVGKALSGGYLPISATIVRDAIYASFTDHTVDRTLQHGHTFCGNPLAAAVALEALRIYAEDDFVARAARLGSELSAAWHAQLQGVSGIAQVRTLGLIAAVDLDPDRTARPGPTRPHRVRLHLLERGILLRPLGHTIYLMPPLVTPAETLRELAAETALAIAKSAS